MPEDRHRLRVQEMEDRTIDTRPHSVVAGIRGIAEAGSEWSEGNILAVVESIAEDNYRSNCYMRKRRRIRRCRDSDCLYTPFVFEVDIRDP